MYGLGPVHPDDRNNPFRYRIDSHRSGWARLVLIALAAVIAAGVWFFNGGNERKSDEVPLIRADQGQTKQRPEQPGGMEIPDQDKLVYDEGKGPKVEQLLPPPEQPLPPPAPEPQAQAQPAPAPVAAPAAAASAPQEPAVPAPAQAPVQAPAPVVTAASQAPAKLAPPPAPKAPPAQPKVAAIQPPPPPPAPPKPVMAQPPATPAPPKSVPAPVQPAAVQPAAPKAASAGGGYRLQLGAVPSEALAQSEWNRIKAAHGDLLNGLNAAFPHVDLGAKGTFYRVQAGPLPDMGRAQELCNALKQRGVGCILVKP